jgi:hypothetical protein
LLSELSTPGRYEKQTLAEEDLHLVTSGLVRTVRVVGTQNPTRREI